MKTDLATSVVLAVVGAVMGYIICDLFIGEIQPVTYTTIEEGVTVDLAMPNEDVFNFRSLNPTVEVYVGDEAENEENNAEGAADPQGDE